MITFKLRHLVWAAAFLAAIILLLGHDPQSPAQQSARLHQQQKAELGGQEDAGQPAAETEGASLQKIRTSEISAGRIDDEAAAALKRTNFEAYLRYQQRLVAGQSMPQVTGTQDRKAAAEERIKQRLDLQLQPQKGS